MNQSQNLILKIWVCHLLITKFIVKSKYLIDLVLSFKYLRKDVVRSNAAKTKLSQLQIHLSYLTYLKTRLVRTGSTFSSNFTFKGNLMQTRQINMQVISAKQRRIAGTISGQGESQLEIQKRNIKKKEASIRKQIEEETRLRNIRQEKNKRQHKQVPIVALVGYTNVGKSALMNRLMKKKQVDSKDLLFQTLSTTSRYIMLPSGRNICLLDTIGFITNLPVQLVESFKSTLQEIVHADIVLHLRDVSNPQRDLQKQSVLDILKDLSFPPGFYQNNMCQVWNKMDLLSSEIQKPNDQSLKISCETGQGFQELLSFLEGKLKHLGNFQPFQIEYGFEKHVQLLRFIKQHTNLPYNLEQIHEEPTNQYPNGSVRIFFDSDENTYWKIMKFLDPERPKKPKNKGMPPEEGW